MAKGEMRSRDGRGSQRKHGLEKWAVREEEEKKKKENRRKRAEEKKAGELSNSTRGMMGE